MTPFHLYLTTNSPGELTSWVRPISYTFKHHLPNCIVTVLLVPCQYASGFEETVARKIPWVDDVWPVKKTLRSLLKKIPRPTSGAVLYLGGDPFYAKAWGKKLKLPAYAYTEHEHVFSGFKHTFKKSVVGNLMRDHVDMTPLPSNRELLARYTFEREPVIFFAGSRPQHFEKLFPFFCDVVSALQHHDPTQPFAIQLSPFLSPEKVNWAKALAEKNGVRLLQAPSLEVLSMAKFLITLPGTNTAEAMFLNTPMLVVMPLNYPNLIILDGLLGLIDKLPLIGYVFKWLALQVLKRKIKFLSHPNRMAQRAIVPEVVGILDMSFVETMKTYLNHPEKIEEIRTNLKSLTHRNGVAETLFQHIAP